MFLNDSGTKTHSKKSSIRSGEVLNIAISLKNGGVLNDGKITINNEALAIVKDQVQSEYVKEINEETREIELNQIANNEQIEIAIPVKLKTQENMNITYFDKETTVKLTGNYKVGDNASESLEGDINLRILWTDEADVQIEQSVEKYIKLEGKGILMQQRIDTKVLENTLPKENETIQIDVPQIDEQAPEILAILLNGQKVLEENYQYDKTLKTLVIENNISVNSENQVKWTEDADSYKVIYCYPEQVGVQTRQIKLKTNAKTKLYTKDEIQKSHEKDVEISECGNVVSINTSMTPSVYKGYLYANSTRETLYSEKLEVEISNLDIIDTLNINTKQDNFITTSSEEKVANTYFKSIELESENVKRILGEEFSIQIQNQNGGNIATINKETQTSEDGKILVNIETTTVTGIKVITNKPNQEGVLNILTKKSLLGQSGYSKDELKTFVNLSSKTEVVSESVTEEKQAKMELKDTIVENRIDINQPNWSTLQTNENIQIVAVLKSNSEKHDLYVDPTINIKLPEEIEKIEVSSIQKLYADEMKIESAGLYEDTKTIEVKLKGEQLDFKNDINEGIQIVVNANITLNKMQPSKTSKIQLTVQNANRNNEQNIEEINVNLKSNYGVVLYNSIKGFNNENDKIETVSQDVVTGNLDLQGEAKKAHIQAAIINNYEDSISNVCLLGKLPNLDENSTLKSSILTNLSEKLVMEYSNAKIYYATGVVEANSQEWKEDIEDISQVKMFKIEIPEINAGESIPINYFVNIPANIAENSIAYQNLSISYLHAGQTLEKSSTIKLLSQKSEENVEDIPSQEGNNENGVDVEVTASTTGKEIQDKGQVIEGQVIRYDVTLTNNTGKDLNNFSLTGKQTDSEGNSNVTFFIRRTQIVEDKYTSIMTPSTTYKEDESVKEMKFEKEIFAAGETITYQYEFRINEMTKDNEITKGKLSLKADGYEYEKDLMENQIGKGELQLLTQYEKNEEIEFTEGSETGFQYFIKNISDGKLENVQIEVNIPEGIILDGNYEDDVNQFKYIETTETSAIYEIESLEAGEEVELFLNLEVNRMDVNVSSKDFHFFVKGTVNNTSYYSNGLTKTVEKRLLTLDVIQESSLEGKYIKDKQEVQFTTTITNRGLIDGTIVIEDYLPQCLVVKEAYIEKSNGECVNVDIYGSYVSYEYDMKAGEVIKFVVKVVQDNSLYVQEEIDEYFIENYVEVHNEQRTIVSNTIMYELSLNEESEEGTTNPDDGNEGDSGNNNDDNKDDEINSGIINGVVWIDENRNGIKDEDKYLSNINVILLDNETGEIVKDINQNQMIIKTNQEGQYRFENLPSGSYIVAFEYDSNSYDVTKYQVTDVDNNKNSDVISKKVNIGGSDKVVAITSEINVDNDEISNIDAGFYQRKVFDLSLQKYINRIVVQTSKQTKVTEYNEESLAKVEIHSKEIANATVIVEYKIRVKNEGEVAGYVKELVDYLPKNMTFSSEINKQWYLSTDGNLHNVSLENMLINPGESKELTLTLTKVMNENNTGTVLNVAEIQKDGNDFNIEDKDSISGNKKDNEDDISSAEVIISISTGIVPVISVIIIMLAILIIAGIIIYKERKGKI